MLELNAVTEDGPAGPELVVTWSWPSRLLTQDRVGGLAVAWFRALDALTAHTVGLTSAAHTPSDLTFGGLSQDELDEIEAEFADDPELELS